MSRRSVTRSGSKAVVESAESRPAALGVASGRGSVGEHINTVLCVTNGGRTNQNQAPATATASRANAQAGPSDSRSRAKPLVESPASNQHGGSPEREHSKESRRTTKKKRDNSGRPGSSSSAENIALSAPKLDVVSPEDQTRPPQLSPVSTVADLGGEAIVPQLPSVEVKGIRKRTLSTSSGHSDDYASSLTPLTSPADARVKPLFPPTTNIAPRLARQFMRAQARAQSASRAHGKLKKASLLNASGSIDSLFAPLDSTDDESGDETDVGSLVWVCIDFEGHLAICNDQSDEDLIWWPAKVLAVSLYVSS